MVTTIKTDEKEIRLYSVVVRITTRNKSILRENAKLWVGGCYSLDEAIKNCVTEFLHLSNLTLEDLVGERLEMYSDISANDAIKILTKNINGLGKEKLDANDLKNINIDSNELIKILIEQDNSNLLNKFKKYIPKYSYQLIKDKINKNG